MSTDDATTFRRAKDKALIALATFFGSLIVSLLSWILLKLYDIEIRLVKVESVKEDVQRLRTWQEQHDRDDILRFRAIGYEGDPSPSKPVSKATK